MARLTAPLAPPLAWPCPALALPSSRVPLSLVSHDLSSGPTVRLKAPDGTLRPLSVDNLHTLLAPMGVGIEQLDLRRFADRVFAGLYDGVSESELDRVLMQVLSLIHISEPTRPY